MVEPHPVVTSQPAPARLGAVLGCGQAVDRSDDAQSIHWMAAFDRLPQPVALLDEAGRIASANRALARFLGVADPTSLIGTDLTSRLDDDELTHYRRSAARATQTGTSLPRLMRIRVGVTGGTSSDPRQATSASSGDSAEGQVWVEATFARLSDVPGERRLVVELIDASVARKRQLDMLLLQQRAYHAEQLNRDAGVRAAAEAAASVEHRLRTAVDSILGHADILSDANVSAASREEALQAIRNAGRSLMDWIRPEVAAPVQRPQPAPAPTASRGQAGTAAVVAPAEAVPATIAGRVLVVEDSKDNQRLMCFLLAKLGLQVEVADHGVAALAKVDEMGRSFDLVLMDMQMPEMDGYQASIALRRKGFDRPIVALTAHARAGDREKCIEAGCTDYLTKPVDRRQLAAVLASHLAGHASTAGRSANREGTGVGRASDDRVRLDALLADLGPSLERLSAAMAGAGPLANGAAGACRRLLESIAARAAERAQDALATLASEAANTLLLNADAPTVHQAIGRVIHAVSNLQQRAPIPMSNPAPVRSAAALAA